MWPDEAIFCCLCTRFLLVCCSLKFFWFSLFSRLDSFFQSFSSTLHFPLSIPNVTYLKSRFLVPIWPSGRFTCPSPSFPTFYPTFFPLSILHWRNPLVSRPRSFSPKLKWISSSRKNVVVLFWIPIHDRLIWYAWWIIYLNAPSSVPRRQQSESTSTTLLS